MPLVVLAHVQEDGRRALVEERARLRRRDLVDLGSDLGEELAVGRHYFPEYSESRSCGGASTASITLPAAVSSRLPWRREPSDARPRSHARSPRCSPPSARSWSASLQGERARSAAPPVETAEPREGAPPLGLDLGVREDAEARDLRRAEQLYADGDLSGAKALFERHDSLEARVGRAFASWPDGTLDRLEQLAGLHPGRAVVQLHLGIARYWSAVGGEREAWQAAAEAEPDTAYRVTADNLLFPEFARGIPVFVATTPAAPRVRRARARPAAGAARAQRRVVERRQAALRGGAPASGPAALRRARLRRRRTSRRPVTPTPRSPPPSGCSRRRVPPPRSRSSGP